MNNHQLLSKIKELQRQLFVMRRVLSTIESLSDEAFNGLDDQWRDSLEGDLIFLHQQFRRFQAAQNADDFLDLIVAGRPHVAELLVNAEAVAKKVENGFLTAFDTLNHEGNPGFGFTSWSQFEHVFGEFLAKHLSLLTAANDLIQLEESQKPTLP